MGVERLFSVNGVDSWDVPSHKMVAVEEERVGNRFSPRIFRVWASRIHFFCDIGVLVVPFARMDCPFLDCSDFSVDLPCFVSSVRKVIS